MGLVSIIDMDSQEGVNDREEANVLPLYDPNYDYYSVDNILEEDVLLKIKVKNKLYMADCLRESDQNGVINENTEIELPAWIALPLVRNHFVELVEPDAFSSSFLSQLWAEPKVVNMRYKCPSYYEMGCRYAQLAKNPTFVILLLRSYLMRSNEIERDAESRYNQDNTDIIQRLTNSEQVMFRRITKDRTKEMKWWSKSILESTYLKTEFQDKKAKLLSIQ